MRKEAEVYHALRGEISSGETLNRWTRYGKTSVSRHLTWTNGKNGLHDVLVIGFGWTKI